MFQREDHGTASRHTLWRPVSPGRSLKTQTFCNICSGNALAWLIFQVCMSLGSSFGFSHVLRSGRKEKENPKNFVCKDNRSIVSNEEEDTPIWIKDPYDSLNSDFLQHLLVHREYVWPYLQLIVNDDCLHFFKINSGMQILSHINWVSHICMSLSCGEVLN